MACCERNHEGKIDYAAFVDIFHEPSTEIGFNLAVLLTNLSEHMPNEPRLARFLETAGSVLNYFEPFLGRIEIMGSSKRIERVYFEIKDTNIEQWEKPQIRESKKAFFYSIVTEGDKEKLEAFVNFCEDAIFEMQHASALMPSEDEGGNVRNASSYSSYVSEEEEERAARNPITRTINGIKNGLKAGVFALSPGNIKHQITVLQSMTVPELIIGFLKLILYFFYYTGYANFAVVRYFAGILLSLMRGPPPEEVEEAPPEEDRFGRRALPALPQDEAPSTMSAFGLDISKEENGQFKVAAHESPGVSPTSSVEETEGSTPEEVQLGPDGQPIVVEPHQEPVSIVDLLGGEAAKKAAAERQEAQKAQEAAMASIDAEAKKSASVPQETPAVNQIPFGHYGQKIVSLLARNFYKLKNIALVLAFTINFLLLFYQITTYGEGEEDEDDLIMGSGSGGGTMGSGFGSGEGSGEGEEDEEALESIHVDEEYFYVEHVLRGCAILHSIISFCMLVAYYQLKVPLGMYTLKLITLY